MKQTPADPRILTDRDVARMLGISVRTLQQRMQEPRAGELDLRRAEPQKIGGRRFWVRERVERTIGLIPQSALLGALRGAKAKASKGGAL